MPDWAEFYRGRTVLITGDTGFKGSWLSLWLTHLGARVVGYALPPVRADDNFVLCNVGSRIRHQDGDIRDTEALAKLFAETRPEVAFHLAAQPLVLDSYARPAHTFDVNVQGTVAFLEAVRRTSEVRAAVVITTDKCYENRNWPWGYREIDRLGGSDPYSASKACAELVVAAYRASFFATPEAASVATARAGNVIGAGDWADNRILPDCVRALRRGEPITVRHPEAIRPWQHVLDPLCGYLMLGQRLATDAALAAAWNFGPEVSEHFTVRDLVTETIAAWGCGEFIESVQAAAPPETLALRLDASKARSVMGWRPRISFRTAVQMTIEGYRADQGLSGAALESRIMQLQHFMSGAGES